MAISTVQLKIGGKFLTLTGTVDSASLLLFEAPFEEGERR